MEYFEQRWKQRFQNFSRTFLLLKQSIVIEDPSITERAGQIQFFEMAFEQSWKVLKDFLEEEGFEVKSPRDAIKIAFQYGFITDGELWLQALKDRNLTVHTYDEATAILVETNIKNLYFPLLEELYNSFLQRLTAWIILATGSAAILL